MKTAKLIERIKEFQDSRWLFFAHRSPQVSTSDSTDKMIIISESELTELLKQHAIEFTLNQSPRTPIIIDGEKKVRERIEKLYNEWITNK